MAAATADRDPRYAGMRQCREIDAAAAAKVFGGTLACVNAAGNGVPAADTAGLRLAGVSRGDIRNGLATCDNSTGAIGDKKFEVYTRGVFGFALAGAAKTSVGKPCWVLFDNEVTLTPGYVFAGIIKDVDVDAGLAYVDIEPAVRLPGVSSKQLIHIPAAVAGVIGTPTMLSMVLTRALNLVRGDCVLLTAPGGGKTLTVTITDGTTTVTLTIAEALTTGGGALVGQFPAGATLTISAAQTGGGAAADLNVILTAEEL